MRNLTAVLSLVATLAIPGCSRDDAATDAARAAHPSTADSDAHPVVSETPADQIAWFDGSVDEALAHASDTGRPVFLYWGAAWCPPCHEVKATVFRSPEFLTRSRLFVPVYLDGDTEDAQQLGERFGVLGYPTMIVLNAAGDEITRIPGGSDIQAYANVLDLTLSTTGAASDLVARVLGDADASLDAADCALLAYYSWGQDTSLLTDHDEVVAFERMMNACGHAEAAARSVLTMRYLDAAIDAAGDEPPFDEAGTAQALTAVHAMLADDGLTRANMYTVLLGGQSLAAALTADGSAERERLVEAFHSALDRIAGNDDVFQTERLYTRYGKVLFAQNGDRDAALPASLIDEIRAAVEAADAGTKDPYARQSVINAAYNLLSRAGMNDDARVLLLKELDISKQPYYFMVSLADIDQSEGNFPDAIGWLKRAYDLSTGPATRFQWGNYYVTGLIEMVPEEGERIEAATVALIDELAAARAFYQRPKRHLAGLEKKLQEWNSDGNRDAIIERIRSRMRSVCATIPPAEGARGTCDAFLAGDPDAPAGAATG